MVDIVIGAAITPVQNNPNKRENQRRAVPAKKLVKERRKNKEDRRRSLRSGVTVTLSKYPDRRRSPDRRKTRP